MEIKITIEAPELAEAINNLAVAIAGKNTVAKTEQETTTTKTPDPVKESGIPLAEAPKFTVEQIMSAGATLMDAGKTNELIDLLHSFGVQAVMDLKPEQLGAFATKMRELGAKI